MVGLDVDEGDGYPPLVGFTEGVKEGAAVGCDVGFPEDVAMRPEGAFVAFVGAEVGALVEEEGFRDGSVVGDDVGMVVGVVVGVEVGV